MSTRPSAVASVSSLTHTWPDGTVCLAGLDLLVPPGRSGLVGLNGSGKSTLLRLLAGDLRPTTGRVRVDGRVGYLRQDVVDADDELVLDLLGIGATVRAIESVERGECDPERLAALLEVIGEDWDLAERTTAELARLGLDPAIVRRRAGELSGGELVRVGLARVLLTRPDVLLLDEPTNNLDREARAFLDDLVVGWPRTLLVVSHDRELLERVERIAELREGRVRWYGGGWTSYLAQVAAEQEAAQVGVSAARSELRRQRDDRIRAETTLAQRRRVARRAEATQGLPQAVVHRKRNQAQESAAAYRSTHAAREDDARARLVEACERVREDREIRVDLSLTQVARGREVLRTTDLVLRTGAVVDLPLRGPERVAVVGVNGAGKTTLLHTVAGVLAPRSGTVEPLVPVGLLRQRLDGLDPATSVVDNVVARAPGADLNEVRAALARFLFRGATADKPVAVLSGGERFRAALAAVLLARPAPRLLLLDEPTNNLDVASYDALVGALRGYRGALLVASHDDRFLADIGVERRLDLSSDRR